MSAAVSMLSAMRAWIWVGGELHTACFLLRGEVPGAKGLALLCEGSGPGQGPA